MNLQSYWLSVGQKDVPAHLKWFSFAVFSQKEQLEKINVHSLSILQIKVLLHVRFIVF